MFAPLASLYIHFVFCISYFVLYLYFLSQRAQPIVPTSVEGRVGGLTYVRYLRASLHILSIFCFIVTWQAGLGRLHLLY